MSEYTNAEYFDMIMCVGAVDNTNLMAARKLYGKRYKKRRLPSHNCFRRIVHRLLTTGSFCGTSTNDRLKTKKWRNAQKQVLDKLDDSDQSMDSETPRLSVWQELKENGLKSNMNVELTDEDRKARLEFCTWYQEQKLEDENFPNLVLWTGRRFLTKNGFQPSLNHKSKWESDSDDEMKDFKINVWVGIIGEKLIGPFFIPRQNNAKNYLKFLTEQLEEYLEDELPVAVFRNIVFQQNYLNGTGAQVVTNYLDGRFQKWIGLNGTITWPLHSSDLNLVNFFLWNYLESLVSTMGCTTAVQTQRKIRAACKNLTPQVLQNVIKSVDQRTALCVEKNGGKIEAYL